MRYRLYVLCVLLSLVICAPALAESHPTERVNNATDVLQQFVNIPENAIPPKLLRSAQGIAIFPSVLKFGFIFGGRHGTGLVAVRKGSGKWSKPLLVSLTSASVGFQAGASSTDIILVFKTRRSVERIAHGQFNLGADASVAAGPVGRQTGASTNLKMKAEIYSYSRSRGLFAGVSIDGGRISIDQNANWLFYDKAGISGEDILDRGGSLKMPKAGQRLVYTLNQYLPASSQGGNENDTPSRDQSAEPSASGQNGNASRGDGIGQSRALDKQDGVSVQRSANESTGQSGQNTGARQPATQGERGGSTASANRSGGSGDDYGSGNDNGY